MKQTLRCDSSTSHCDRCVC